MGTIIVGAGFIAETHAAALRSCGAHVCAVIEKDASRARAFAEKWNIQEYTDDFSRALADDVDCVHICTPPKTHFEMAKELAAAGKHIYCEKPLSLSPDEAGEMAQMAREAGILNATGFNVRYHMAVQRAKEIIGSGALGRILLVHGSYLQEFHALPVPADWRYNKEEGGRMLAVTEIGTHWFDLAEYLSGKKIAAVSADFGRFWHDMYVGSDGLMRTSPKGLSERREIDVELAACISLRFEDGAIGSVVLSESSPGRGNYLSIEITGEKKNIWWDSESYNVLRSAEKGTGVNSEIFAFGNGFSDTFSSLMSRFYAAVRQGRRPETPDFPTFDDGARIVRVCEACYKSDKNNSSWESVL